MFAGKRYLPVRLIETTRGCRFPCDFCAIQTFFNRTARHRPIADILADTQSPGSAAKFHFFVDDSFAADISFASEFADAVAPIGLRWVTQMSINAAHDDALLARLKKAGCVGVLIGFETLDPDLLRQMRKNFNAMEGGYRVALANLRRHGIRVYGTFVFGDPAHEGRGPAHPRRRHPDRPHHRPAVEAPAPAQCLGLREEAHRCGDAYARRVRGEGHPPTGARNAGASGPGRRDAVGSRRPQVQPCVPREPVQPRADAVQLRHVRRDGGT
ncbi:MAG TPA: hypothetical protein DIU07_20590 [Rhodobacteraceae bacterium]|nr:hypothetical protein [Paracoccaceae bacterium]